MGGWTGTRLGFAVWRLWRRREVAFAGLMLLAACGDYATVPPSTVVSSTKWGPLQPKYDRVVRAWGGNGKFENRGNSAAVVVGDYRDPYEDGNPAYVRVEFLSKGPRPSAGCSGSGSTFTCTSGTSSGWNSQSSQSTPEIGTSKGQRPIKTLGNADLAQTLLPQDDAERGAIYVCSQFGWPVDDPCALASPSFAY